MNTIILRRRKLGRTSCREVQKYSQEGILAVRNDKPIPRNLDMVIRWGCTSNVDCKNVLNKAAAIHLVSDKTRFRLMLEEAALCTSTFFSVLDAVEAVGRGAVKFDFIVRPRHHHQGRQLYRVHNEMELIDAVNKCGHGFYINSYVPKVSEYRVFVVQGRAIAVAQKTPENPNDVAWNVAKGGRFDNVRWDDWPLKAVKNSIDAFNLSGLDFGGVDVMIDAQGNCYILEINSAPSLTSPYRQECFAKAFDYIIRNGKKHIPLVDRKGGYTKFIHPAVCEKAKLINEERAA